MRCDRPRTFGAGDRKTSPHHVTRATQVSQLGRGPLVHARVHVAHQALHRLGVVAEGEFVDASPGQAGGIQPKQFAKCLVGLHDVQRLVDERHTHAGLLEDRTESRVGAPPRGDSLVQRPLDPGGGVRQDRPGDQQERNATELIE